MQRLHALALEPVAEMMADPNSYGFRPHRSTADAIGQCFTVLARKDAAAWILEGDIRACFDTINHQWLGQNIPMDGKILCTWLKAGYIDKSVYYRTEEGAPQGSPISPILANMTLDGLEDVITRVVSRRDKVHVVRYCDDFIVTGATRAILEQKVKPALKAFLAMRGLELSERKTQITHIKFDGMSKSGQKQPRMIPPTGPTSRDVFEGRALAEIKQGSLIERKAGMKMSKRPGHVGGLRVA
jgi:RNA-directed DNA polymerase